MVVYHKINICSTEFAESAEKNFILSQKTWFSGPVEDPVFLYRFFKVSFSMFMAAANYAGSAADIQDRPHFIIDALNIISGMQVRIPGKPYNSGR
jgi:hypothetical protein